MVRNAEPTGAAVRRLPLEGVGAVAVGANSRGRFVGGWHLSGAGAAMAAGAGSVDVLRRQNDVGLDLVVLIGEMRLAGAVAGGAGDIPLVVNGLDVLRLDINVALLAAGEGIALNRGRGGGLPGWTQRGRGTAGWRAGRGTRREKAGENDHKRQRGLGCAIRLSSGGYAQRQPPSSQA